MKTHVIDLSFETTLTLKSEEEVDVCVEAVVTLCTSQGTYSSYATDPEEYYGLRETRSISYTVRHNNEIVDKRAIENLYHLEERLADMAWSELDAEDF